MGRSLKLYSNVSMVKISNPVITARFAGGENLFVAPPPVTDRRGRRSATTFPFLLKPEKRAGESGLQRKR